VLRPKNRSRFHYCSRFQFDVARMPEYGLTDKSGVYGALTSINVSCHFHLHFHLL
jgi:hypothetical protein